jgi:hypothetical protein
MGKVKQQLIEIEEYLYNPSQGLPTWKAPISESRARDLRNSKQHQEWFEDMPDLQGQALADAEREFLETVNEADDLPLWIQLELDLWEGQHGINEQTYWDVAAWGHRG